MSTRFLCFPHFSTPSLVSHHPSFSTVFFPIFLNVNQKNPSYFLFQLQKNAFHLIRKTMETWNNENYHDMVFKTFVPPFFKCLSTGLLFDSTDSNFSSAGDEAVRLVMFLHKQNVSRSNFLEDRIINREKKIEKKGMGRGRRGKGVMCGLMTRKQGWHRNTVIRLDLSL